MKNGIDVSYHNGVIDWAKVKKDGYDFAIIRAGYGKTTIDKQFLNNVNNAIKHGFGIGFYWFVYGVNVEEMVENAKLFIKTIAPYKNNITHKVWCDFEYDTEANANKRGVVFNKETRTTLINAFCDYMKSQGYDVGVYANKDYVDNKLNDIDYPLWFARYATIKGNYDCFMWQHSSKGIVDGINGHVDLNILYGEAEQMPPTYYDSPEFTLIDSLSKIGVDTSFNHRAKIAKANGIKGYKGTSAQNLQLLSLLNEGKLIKV